MLLVLGEEGERKIPYCPRKRKICHQEKGGSYLLGIEGGAI